MSYECTLDSGSAFASNLSGLKAWRSPPFPVTEGSTMAARLSVHSHEPSRQADFGKEEGPKSDVWVVRPSLGPPPSPAAFAIHDAKNMIGILTANIEVLKRALQGMALPTVAAEAFEDIDESAGRLSGLLREALSGLQGRTPQQSTPSILPIAPQVAAVVDRIRPAARARGVRIVHSGQPDTVGSIEAELFERVLVNLLENAVRFSQPGDTVEVEYIARSGRVTLAVGDRGPGVPEIAREEIFRSYRNRDPQATGSHFGLGLAFCREVARAHNGDAWVFNRAQGGACFVFEIA
jgi:signal transduction histidine kinase